MLRRLELEALRADLATVEGALARHTVETDPIGRTQFQRRAANLRSRIAEYENVRATSAQVAVFFGGNPVIGSRGIDATFGSQAVRQFQRIISMRYASMVNELGARGPIPQRQQSQMMISDVARGSFGFVLEEADNDQLINTGLKESVSDVTDLVYRIGAPDEEAYESGLDDLDRRLLIAMKKFFKLLGGNGATLRLVDDNRDFLLPRDSIERAVERMDSITITEAEPVAYTGVLYVLPADKIFELHPDVGDAIKGKISNDGYASLLGADGQLRGDILQTRVTANLVVKTVSSPRHQIEKKTYTFRELVE